MMGDFNEMSELKMCMMELEEDGRGWIAKASMHYVQLYSY